MKLPVPPLSQERRPAAQIAFASCLTALGSLAGCGPSKLLATTGETGSGDNTGVSSSSSGSSVPTTGGLTGCDSACTGASEGGTAEAVTSEGVTFILPTDAGGGTCDSWAQNCPPGHKCVAYANDGGNVWNALKCVPVASDPKQPGEECVVDGSYASGVDDCDAGAMCWPTPLGTMGTCQPLCKGTPQESFCENPGDICFTSYEGLINLCFSPCNPLVQDCAEAEVCVQSGNMFLCMPDGSGREGQQHDPCEFISDCDPDLFCANGTAAVECDQTPACCQPYCDLNNPKCDGGVGQTCLPYFEPGDGPPGLEHVGKCSVP